jgi:hypothetical protein
LISAESFLAHAERKESEILSFSNNKYEIFFFFLELCRKSAEEESMEKEELQNELAPIQIQLGFIRQQLGKPDEAVEIYNTVLKAKSLSLFLLPFFIICHSIIFLLPELEMKRCVQWRRIML